MSPRGHRTLEHTADTAFMAWAPTLGGCLEEAAVALVESFADASGAKATNAVEVQLGSTPDAALISLLEEIIYLLEVRGGVPANVSVRGEIPDVSATLELAGTDDVLETGAVPKAIAHSDLEIAKTDDGWRCRFTVDV